MIERVFYNWRDKAYFNNRVQIAEMKLKWEEENPLGEYLKPDDWFYISIKENNKAFLCQLEEAIIPKGIYYCERWLRGVLVNYAKRCAVGEDYQLQDYIDWLKNTRLILGGKHSEILKWCNDYEAFITNYWNRGNGGNKTESFCDIIQYKDKEKLLERLHFLIDGKGGAEVGAVIMKAKTEGYLTRYPTRGEFIAEFNLSGSWQGIHNYFNEDNNNCLAKANNIIIF